MGLWIGVKEVYGGLDLGIGEREAIHLGRGE